MSTYTQHFTANSLKKIELFIPEDISVTANSIKPKPPLGGFHKGNRQRTSNNHGHNLVNTSPKCFTQVFDGKLLSLEKNKIEKSEVNKTSKRRVQSAKPRLISERETEVTHITKGQQVKTRRPVSAIILGSENHWNYSYSSSAKLSGSECILPLTSQSEGENVKCLEPCVFGYKTQAYICGTEYLADSYPTAPCKIVDAQQDITAKTRHLQDNDNVSLSELIDFEDNEEDSNVEEDDSIPSTLRPLIPWATPDIPQDMIGIDPATCLIFLPSLIDNVEQIPCVPPPLKPNEDLVYKERITSPKVQQETKKYDHPWKPLPIEEHSCNNTTKQFPESCESIVKSPRQIKVYNLDGILLHKSDCGQRNERVVRKEIQELEDLMQGIGTLNGCSVVVQYQAEINILQNMLKRTMSRVEEIERREEEKNKSLEPPDHFGLRTFYKKHDEVMEQLHKQHSLCVQELATLTEELNLNTARSHFEKSLNGITSKETDEGH